MKCLIPDCIAAAAHVPRIKHGPEKWQAFYNRACCSGHIDDAAKTFDENEVVQIIPIPRSIRALTPPQIEELLSRNSRNELRRNERAVARHILLLTGRELQKHTG